MSPRRRDFFKRVGLFVTGAWAWQPGPRRSVDVATSAQTSRRPAAIGGDLVRGEYDVVVVGGGISGTSAAISAARNGMKVALVHERSMLGGNSSSEVKLFPENNSGHHPWIKESGIHDELHTEERVRNHQAYVEGTMNCHWDLVLYEWVIREPNITLFLNTHMHNVQLHDPAHIAAVQAIQLGTEKSFDLTAPLFVDATGDGVLGYRAGADFRWGREAHSEYHEPLAPGRADEAVMGNTLFFRAVDTGRPVPFKLPAWAASFPAESDLTSRGHGFIEGGYWWIEVGAPYHPIKDNEQIRHEALRQLLGVWDHIKNRGAHGATNYGLEFVGFWPYKREARRILGDYVLAQQHVQNPTLLHDAVAYGCWGIDIHVQGGILTRDQPPYPPPSQHWEELGSQVYGIPIRALYSRNVENLMMAGRPISGSYVAFASSRVLSRGSIVGQAVGVAASLCKKYRTTPRVVANRHAEKCQQIILRQDGHIPGVANADPNDLARRARVTASSDAMLEFPESGNGLELNLPHAQLFPVSGDRIDVVELLLGSKLSVPTELRLALRAAPHVWDFRSTRDLAEARVQVPPGYTGWLAFPLRAQVEPEQLYYIYTNARPGISWKMFTEVAGEPSRCPVGSTPANLPGPTRWRPLVGGRSLCMRITPASRPYGPQNVIRGTNRPDLWTNAWVSDRAYGLPAWLTLQWPAPVRFNTVQLTFDTDANRRVILPLFRYPDCVKDYRLEQWTAGGWSVLAEGRDNYVRRRVHSFDAVWTDRLRLQILATNGSPSARVYEMRVYDEGS